MFLHKLKNYFEGKPFERDLGIDDAHAEKCDHSS